MRMNASELIETLGGTTAVARIFSIKPPSVSEWKANGEIPAARLMYLKLLRPDLFKASAVKKAA